MIVIWTLLAVLAQPATRPVPASMSIRELATRPTNEPRSGDFARTTTKRAPVDTVTDAPGTDCGGVLRWAERILAGIGAILIPITVAHVVRWLRDKVIITLWSEDAAPGISGFRNTRRILLEHNSDSGAVNIKRADHVMIAVDSEQDDPRASCLQVVNVHCRPDDRPAIYRAKQRDHPVRIERACSFRFHFRIRADQKGTWRTQTEDTAIDERFPCWVRIVFKYRHGVRRGKKTGRFKFSLARDDTMVRG